MDTTARWLGMLITTAALFLAAGCDDAPADDDGGTPPDAGPRVDAGPQPDAGPRPDAGPQPDAGPRPDAGDPPAGDTLSDDYPGDVGLGGDPDVIWFEDFEAGSVGAIAARYDQVQGMSRWSLVTDTPNGTGSALALRAGQGESAVDMYKRLPNADEWYVRWYARYENGVPWHHSGMWIGGYNPSMSYPSPMAGNRPDGDDRFSIAIEPVYDGPSGERFDFYNYWMGMRSWMADPVNDNGSAYYGNGLVHRNDFTIDEESWVCLELHVRLNPSPSSGAGAVLEVWKNDALVRRFDDAGPMGWWIRDKFCPADSDGTECTDYPAPADTILDLQMRNTTDLALNAFWPQNYISDDAMGTLTFDQMVVASRRVGCMR